MRAPLPRRRLLGTSLVVAATLIVASATTASARPTGDTSSTTSTTTTTTVAPTSVTTTTVPDTTCKVAAGNARFVRFIYLKILERCPEPAAVAYFTKRLDAGLTRFNFAETIDMSNENLVKNNVVGIYRGVLDRAPTSQELADGVAFIRANHQDGHLIAKLLSSDEAYATLKGATTLARDKAWLKLASESIVEAAPSPGDEARWLRSFGTSSSASERLAVAIELEESPANATSWIFGVYGAGLGRAAEPKELEFWMRWLNGRGHWQTFRMWTNVLSSSEAYALAQTQPPLEQSEH